MRRLTLVMTVLALLPSCKLFHKKETNKPTGGKERPEDKGATRREFDLNHDGMPDLWKVYKTENGNEHLVRKELDLNFDGKVDIYDYYDDKGILIKDEIDLDHDGKIDVVTFYEDGKPVRKEEDL